MADLYARIAELEAENAELRKALKQADGMMEYTENKYKRLFARQGLGYAKEIRDTINLELLDLRDLCENLSDRDRARFVRRIDRIDEYLEEFGQESAAALEESI